MRATHKRALSEQERAERRQRDREYAHQAVERLRSSDGWQQWLATRRYFRSYSLANQLLIAMARPTATRVAGFRAWLKLGYSVRKRPAGVPEGQWAIRIWTPCPPSQTQLERWERAGADPSERPRTHFKLAAVFAQDQVEPLPPPAVPAPLDPPIRDVDGDELADVIPNLVDLGGQIGSTVAFEAIAGGAHGYYESTSRRIVVDERMSANQRVKTLCHELAHALVRHDRQPDDPNLDYAGEELVAESVAYTCLGAVGISSEEYSIPYLAAWAESSELEVLEHTAALIDRLAARIESALHNDTASPGGASDVTVARS
jgi:antirestriction protein ArdC